jgi:hypothetical protein
MESQLKVLVNLRVESTAELHDYLQLFFEEGSILSIYNEFELSDSGDTNSLQGATLKKVEETQDTIALDFSNEQHLRIDLRDEAYRGPEAVVLHVPGKFIVVWN